MASASSPGVFCVSGERKNEKISNHVMPSISILVYLEEKRLGMGRLLFVFFVGLVGSGIAS